MLLVHEARVAALLGDTGRLQKCADALQRVPQHDLEAPARAQRALLPAYLADAEGDTARALAVRRHALQQDRLLSRLGLGVETRLRLAAALHPAEGAATAANALRPALDATDDATEMAPVLLAGPAVLHSLAHADWAGQLDTAQVQRLRAWAGMAIRLRHGPATEPSRAPVDALAGLSPRETEVLAHIAAGDSNKLIARALDLSPHTVKRHVANILDKLALQTRGQAAAWYRARR
jgi:LuxR family maltose regulon positive regulatory protein